MRFLVMTVFFVSPCNRNAKKTAVLFRRSNQERTQEGCRGCIPPTRPKEVLTWHLISLKIIAKIFLYCT